MGRSLDQNQGKIVNAGRYTFFAKRGVKIQTKEKNRRETKYIQSFQRPCRERKNVTWIEETQTMVTSEQRERTIEREERDRDRQKKVKARGIEEEEQNQRRKKEEWKQKRIQGRISLEIRK